MPNVLSRYAGSLSDRYLSPVGRVLRAGAKVDRSGSISATPETWQSKTENVLAKLLSKAGMDERNAAQTASQYVNALAMLTPAGNAFDAQTSMRGARSAAARGDTLGRLGNSAMLAVAALPGAGLAKRGVNALSEVRQGIRAYHGSPHDFDRFDINKLGTGEGAQAYGHGLYFADKEDVARGYRDKLSPGGIQPPADADPVAAAAAQRLHWENLRGGNAQTLVAKMERDLASGRLSWDPDAADQIDYLKSGMSLPEVKSSGKMYEVDINADPATLLDWDVPLDRGYVEQNLAAFPHVVEGDAKQRAFLGADKGYTGRAAYAKAAGWQQGADLTPPDAATTSRLLSEAGIPGIKYLDQGSRNSTSVADLSGTVSMLTGAVRKHPTDQFLKQQLETAQADLLAAQKPLSRNYVVFDDKLVNVLRKYGIAGLLAGGAATAATTQSDPQQIY